MKVKVRTCTYRTVQTEALAQAAVVFKKAQMYTSTAFWPMIGGDGLPVASVHNEVELKDGTHHFSHSARVYY